MARVNIAGYNVSANPKAPNSLFTNGDGTFDPADYLRNITITQEGDVVTFTGIDGEGDSRVIGHVTIPESIEGVTFTPHITKIENGYRLSWTNDGNLENPDPVDLLNGERGPEGPKGPEGPQGPPAEIPFETASSTGNLERIAQSENENYLEFHGSNEAALNLPLIFVGAYADPGNNLLLGLKTGTDHGSAGEKNTYLLITGEGGLTYLYMIPDGGAAGYVLSKRSAASYDYGWAAPGNPVIQINSGGSSLSGKFVRVSIGDGGKPSMKLITDAGESAEVLFVPAGGNAGQALIKASNADGDYQWATIPGSNFSVEEVSNILQANFCGADIRIGASPSGGADIAVTTGWRVSFYGNAVNFSFNTSADPMTLTTNLTNLGIPVGGTRRRFTDITLNRGGGKCFAFDLSARFTAMTPGTAGSSPGSPQGVYNREAGNLMYLVGTQTGGYLTGGSVVCGNGWVGAWNETNADISPFDITVSNIKYYRVTEV